MNFWLALSQFLANFSLAACFLFLNTECAVPPNSLPSTVGLNGNCARVNPQRLTTLGVVARARNSREFLERKNSFLSGQARMRASQDRKDNPGNNSMLQPARCLLRCRPGSPHRTRSGKFFSLATRLSPLFSVGVLLANWLTTG